MKKIKRMFAGILLVAVTITAVVGGSAAEVEAKVKRCTEAYVEVGEDDKEIENGKTASMTMCKGMTSEYHNSIFYPFRIKTWYESHKITASSSKPSVVSVSVKSKNIILNAKKYGTATVTIKSSCGNKFKIKITVKDHKYVKDGYATQCKYCEQCIRGVDVTEEEIHQRILDIFGPDEEILEDEMADCIYTGHSCMDFVNWLSEKVWGFKWRSEEYNYHSRIVTDWNETRSGDIILYPDHVQMVVENRHDGTLLVADGMSFYGKISYSDLLNYNNKTVKATIYTIYKD